MGSINIQEFNESIRWVDFAIIIAAALVLCAGWRLIKHWNSRKTFCYWYPTIMLCVVSACILAADHVDSSTKMGAILEGVGIFIFVINFPAIIITGVFIGILGGLFRKIFSLWVFAILAATVFWFSWHMLLRYIHQRALENTRNILDLKPTNPRTPIDFQEQDNGCPGSFQNLSVSESLSVYKQAPGNLFQRVDCLNSRKPQEVSILGINHGDTIRSHD
jgi:hypothetical protein